MVHTIHRKKKSIVCKKGATNWRYIYDITHAVLLLLVQLIFFLSLSRLVHTSISFHLLTLIALLEHIYMRT